MSDTLNFSQLFNYNKTFVVYFCSIYFQLWRVLLTVRKPVSQSGDGSSILLRATLITSADQQSPFSFPETLRLCKVVS